MHLTMNDTLRPTPIQPLDVIFEQYGAWKLLREALLRIVTGRAKRHDLSKLPPYLRKDIGLPEADAPPTPWGPLR